MDVSQEILSEVTIFNKYAKHISELDRRETWEEICERNMVMHIRKFPQLKEEIKTVYKDFVIPKKVLPSMRSMQFAGLPIELSNSRMFNCAFTNVDHIAVFSETMFNLLSGSGVGFSVQDRHISQLPVIKGVLSKRRTYLVQDSIIGWADAIKTLIKAFTDGRSDPNFDFRDIRKKGEALITSGGRAPGPDPLRICIDKIRAVLNQAVGRKLKSIEVYDIMNHIADAVLAGGIRRAAMICIFDFEDMDMLYSKSGDWYILNPQRGRSNNSVFLKRGDITEKQFNSIWEVVKNSGAGEPGFIWTDDLDSGLNPCSEIGLRSNQYCNLTTQDVSDVDSQEELNARSRAASFLGTLQAAYTDFHYLRPIWQDNTEEEALIGVSMTGIASGNVLNLDLTEAANEVKKENIRVANLININPAARTTCIKPEGTVSCVVGSSSGVHAWHDNYYIRRIRVGKHEALYSYLLKTVPDLVEDCVFKPHLDAVLSIPQKAPKKAILRYETVLALLERVKKFNQEWVMPGHSSGIQQHNVSSTISVKEDEWYLVRDWMWKNKEHYTGISVLPYDGGTYVQAPFESCSKETYEKLLEYVKGLDLKSIVEKENNTNLIEQSACAGGACEIK